MLAVAIRGRRPPALFEGSLGPAAVGAKGLRILAIADTAGATLQINLLRPLRAAATSGVVHIDIFTEEQERAALQWGASRKSLIVELWQQAQPDVVFVSRYGGALAWDIIAEAERNQTPLIYHLDDNLLEVPIEAGFEKARKYGSPERQEAIRALLQRSKVAYMSTVRLASQLTQQCSLAREVFVGDIASASDPLHPRQKTSGARQFGYMASSSHAADLQLALPGIITALRALPDWSFTVFGSLKPPPSLSEFGARVIHVAAVGDYDKFLKRLADMNWCWGLAPLCCGRFNEAKTDTKWVEYAAAGIPCILSNHPIYQDCSSHGAAVRVGDEEWTAVLLQVLQDRDLAGRTAAAAHARLVRLHGLRQMAHQVERVLVVAGVPKDQAAAVSAGPETHAQIKNGRRQWTF